MAETDLHRDRMVELIETLKDHFLERSDVYVSGNLLWFYRQGDRHRHISPDCMVRIGVPKYRRKNYLQWEEGGAPQVVFELTSPSTRKEDLGKKLDLYEELGVLEYYLFDPLGEYLKPRFRGYARRGARLVSVLVGEETRSQVLGLDLCVSGDTLRLRVPGETIFLPTPAERHERRADEATRRADEAARRFDEETRRADEEARRADEEARRADEESQRAEEATRRADQQAAENESLRKRTAELEERLLRLSES